jgi:hypothetical protein
VIVSTAPAGDTYCGVDGASVATRADRPPTAAGLKDGHCGCPSSSVSTSTGQCAEGLAAHLKERSWWPRKELEQ